ncbi:hypothetical protein ABZ348_00390 [Streptomyces sp. NPDC005963]|uniref:hypothetical protein n=1 Tax=Streptomyces sp. NPDC005963 TaxID=3156721 RepID=UPI0033C64377
MSKTVKVAIMACAGAAIASTPLYWLLDGPGSGRLVAASVQGATGVVTLAWSLLTTPGTAEPPPVTKVVDVVTDTGSASASAGGTAVSGGLKGSGAGSVSIRVRNSGDATAEGPGSLACSGVYTADGRTT